MSAKPCNSSSGRRRLSWSRGWSRPKKSANSPSIRRLLEALARLVLTRPSSRNPVRVASNGPTSDSPSNSSDSRIRLVLNVSLMWSLSKRCSKLTRSSSNCTPRGWEPIGTWVETVMKKRNTLATALPSRRSGTRRASTKT